MSKDLLSAIKGSSVGVVIGTIFGLLTLGTMGFDRITLFEKYY